MITLQDIQLILADAFLGGNMAIAGMIMFSAVMLLIFIILEDKETALILMIPVTLIFSILEVLDTNLTVILLIVAVVSVALKARRVWST